MRLTINNIKFVKELAKNGTTYAWFVSMKSGNVSDSRNFINYDETGKTTVAEYRADTLPSSVRNFLRKSTPEVFNRREHDNGDVFTEYIYR